MRTSEEMAREFHEAIGHPSLYVPAPVPDARLLLRIELISSEIAELLCAMVGIRDKEITDYYKRGIKRLALDAYITHRKPPDLSDIARQAVDVHVVVSGTSAEFGLPEDEVYEVVHKANMEKVGGPVRGDGKQMRPVGWQEPDVESIIQKYIEEFDDTSR